MAAPRPSAAMVRHAERPGAARLGPALGAGADDVAEGVGAFVAEGGGVGRAAAADRVHDEEEGARHQAMRPRIERRLGAAASRRCGRRRGRAPRRRRAPAASAAWMRASGVSGSTEAPRPSSALEPDRVVDRVAGAAAAAAELDHREAEARGCRWRRRSPRVRRARRRSRARGEVRLEVVEKARGPPSAATMRSKRSAAAPEAKASRIALGARRPGRRRGRRRRGARRRAPRSRRRAGRRSRRRAGSGRRSATSSALPAAVASGSFMSVISARVGQPAPFATSTSASASARASCSVAMKAPEPVFTSSTSASRPAASFFDRIEAVMRSIDSTVPVTSRIA